MLQLTAARRALGLGGADVRQPIGPSRADAFPQWLPQAIAQLIGKERLEAAGAGRKARSRRADARRRKHFDVPGWALINLQPATSPGAVRSLRAPEGAD